VPAAAGSISARVYVKEVRPPCLYGPCTDRRNAARNVSRPDLAPTKEKGSHLVGELGKATHSESLQGIIYCLGRSALKKRMSTNRTQRFATSVFAFLVNYFTVGKKKEPREAVSVLRGG